MSGLDVIALAVMAGVCGAIGGGIFAFILLYKINRALGDLKGHFTKFVTDLAPLLEEDAIAEEALRRARDHHLP